MSILSTNHRLISIGESYSAGNGIDITDQVISVTGDATPYSAGDNIDIQGHVISGKDWTQDITDASSNAYNETTAWVQENYANSADMTYISAVVDTKLDASAWSSVSADYATEDYVIMADNITYDRTTGYVDSQQFAKESACQSAFEQLNTNKLDTSSFAEASANFYTNDNPSGFITGVDLSNYYTKDETSGKEELSNAFANIPVGDPEVNAYVTDNSASINESKSLVQSNSSTWNDITAYQSNSASLNDVSTTVQSNSAQWADGGSGDEEVNSFVYNNSATINEVNTTYQQNSASYQPSGKYISYSSTTATVHGMSYTTDSGIYIQHKVNNIGEYTNELDYGGVRLSLARSNLHENSYLSPGRLSFNNIEDSAYAQVDLSSINKWNDVSTNVQTNSAQWAEGGSNPEVESYVINNSATIDEVNTTYQSNSASYLTAHQSLTNYYTTAEANTMSSMFSGAIDYVSANAGGVISSYTTATIEGTNAINSLNGKPLISFRTQSAQEAGVADKARYDYNGNNLSDDHNSLTSLKSFVQTNSAQWAESGSIPVSNSGDLYKVEFDGVDLYGYKSTTTIPAEPFYSAVSSQENQYLEYSKYPYFYSRAIDNLANWSAFDIISISSNGRGIYSPEMADYEVTALDVYYQASYVFDYNNNQLADVSGYIGKITLDNLVTSSYFDYDNIARCGDFKLWFSANKNQGQLNSNHYICSVGKEVQSDPETIEGIFVPSATDLSNYYTKSETSGASEIAYALANIPTGNPEVESYVQTNSGTIDDTVTSYQTNSGTFLTAHQAISADEWNDCYDNVNTNSGAWGGSALPISAGKGVGIGVIDNTLVVSSTLTGYVWTSASLFTTATPTMNTNYTLSDDCSNYDKLEVDFYDINNFRTQMDCPIPPNLASSGTRGGYFSVVPSDTTTSCNIWFKCFNWTAAQNTWTCYCSEITAQGGSTTQLVNANQPNNPPKVIQIIGWKRVLV